MCVWSDVDVCLIWHWCVSDLTLIYLWSDIDCVSDLTLIFLWSDHCPHIDTGCVWSDIDLSVIMCLIWFWLPLIWHWRVFQLKVMCYLYDTDDIIFPVSVCMLGTVGKVLFLQIDTNGHCYYSHLRPIYPWNWHKWTLLLLSSKTDISPSWHKWTLLLLSPKTDIPPSWHKETLLLLSPKTDISLKLTQMDTVITLT